MSTRGAAILARARIGCYPGCSLPVLLALAAVIVIILAICA